MLATKDRQILRAALLELHRTTGLSGTIARDIAEEGPESHNMVVRIAIENDAQLFVAAIKTDDCPETPVVIKEKFANSGYAPLLVMRHITRKAAEHCRAIQLSFLDTVGNVFLESRGPCVLYVSVRSRRP
jgi:hypothetical protein